MSTLINNYSAIYLINNKDLFKPKSFIKVITNKSVKVGLFMLLILGYKTHIIKRILNNALRPIIIDLILKNVIIIKGFYVNIILEAYLRELSV